MSRACLSDADVLASALDPVGSARLGAHLAVCGRCRGRGEAVRAAGAAVRAASGLAPAAGEACLDEARLARLVDSVAEPDERRDAVEHLARCGRCRRELAALVELLADPEIAEAAGRVGPADTRTPRPWAPWAIIGLATAAALLLIVRPARQPAEHRGPILTAAEAPAPVEPVGDVAPVTALRWLSVPGVGRYRVTVFSPIGDAVFEATVSDTVAVLPDSIALEAGQSYLWKVEARTGWDRWAASELMEFRIVPELRPDADTGQPRDSLHLLARRVSDSALVAEVQARPLEIREAVTLTLGRASRGHSGSDGEDLAPARRLAVAYQKAWRDDFLLREVARFARWSPADGATKLAADSMRRAGIAALGESGAAAAIALWRVALAKAGSIGDSVGMAATLGNIGAGFAVDGRPDSAESYLSRSRELAAAVGDLRVEANAVSELAGLRERRGEFAAANDLYGRAIGFRRRIGDSRGLAADYNNLAGLARALGDRDEARRQLTAALALNRRDGRTGAAATNLVNLAAIADDFAQAESYYRQALAIWRSNRQWADVADAERGLGGLEVRRGNYPAASARLLGALALYQRTGPAERAIETRAELAAVRAAQGDLQGALDDLRSVQRAADTANLSADVRAGVALAGADLAAQLNRPADADRLYTAAAGLYQQVGDRVGEGAALSGQGVLSLGLDDAALAERLFDRALAAQTAGGNLRGAALARLWLGEAALRRGDTAAARLRIATATTELIRLKDPVAAAAALGERAALEAGAGYPAAADSFYRAALAVIGSRVAPAVTWQLHAGLGAVRRIRGGPEAAAKEFRAAIADLESAAGTLRVPERRTAFLADKWDVYADLALLEQGRGRIAASFEVSERLRASEMLALLDHGRIPAPADTAIELVTREQDLRRRIGELTRGLEAGPAGGQALRGPDIARGAAVDREALLRAQESYAHLLLEIRDRAPRHGELVTREVSSWRDVARRLAPDEAFIEYLTGEPGSLAYVVTTDTIAAVPLAATRRDVARLVDFVRATLAPRGTPRLDSLWRSPLRQLHRDLMEPILASRLLISKRRLVIVPHAELHYLPFAALVSAGGRDRFLVEQFEVVETPSASVWLALGDRRRDAPVAGTLAFAPRPDLLPASRIEVAAVSRLAGADALVVVGNQATEATFRREAPRRRILHLATFGVLNKQNPLFSFVDLAPGGGRDGALAVHEVFGLRLAADLVVLSACQTGLGSGALADVPAGDDWIGLGRAFLSAGAKRVVASLWPVQDRATASLMERFYGAYARSSDAGQALASAQRALLSRPETASPFYWAGFVVIGGR